MDCLYIEPRNTRRQIFNNALKPSFCNFPLKLEYGQEIMIDSLGSLGFSLVLFFYFKNVSQEYLAHRKPSDSHTQCVSPWKE